MGSDPHILSAVRFLRVAALACAALLSAGCLVTTLQPAFDEQSIVFEPALVGRWVREEAGVTVVIERGEWRSFHLTYTDRFGTYQYTAYLTTIGKGLYLVVRPEHGVEPQAFLLNTHGVLKLEIGPAEVRVAELDYDAAASRVERGSFGIAAALDDRKNILVTADTKRLRAWIDAHRASPGWWAEWKTFERKGEP